MNYGKITARNQLRRTALIVGSILFCVGFNNFDSASCETPTRLVVIKGHVTLLDHPTLGKTNATGTLAFQKQGCEACYIGAEIDPQGNYEILVGDGKYRVMYLDPTSESDYLSSDQARIIDTQTDESRRNSQQVFRFDVSLKVSKSRLE